ncbi:hypothetical protein ACFCYI_38395 [Streptomyces sp. NPDC056257]|uniref:hypothetical protein n=1 Tax=Streptomyces sp. NPDC056257 TaxID=3345765 RepID=UPI0035DF0322
MISDPRLHGKSREEVVEEIRVYLTRIERRRKRFQATSQNQLREVRTRVVEAVAAGLAHEEAAAAAGYQPATVSKWVAKHRTAVRPVDLATARHRLDKIRQRQRSMAAAELRISRKAKLVVRRAIAVEFTAEEFAGITTYNLEAVERWFTAVRNRLEQTRRRRELASVRRGKANRPPQELSPAEYARWLARETQRRRAVLQRYGMRPRRKKPAPPPEGNRLRLKSPGRRRHRRK